MIGAVRAIVARVLKALAPWRLVVVAFATVGLVALGLAFHLDIGSLCAVCPLGLAQISAAARSVSPMLVWSVLTFAAIALFFGRLLCAWLCPTNLLPWRRGVFAASRRRGHPAQEASAGRARTVSESVPEPASAAVAGSHEETPNVVGLPDEPASRPASDASSESDAPAQPAAPGTDSLRRPGHNALPARTAVLVAGAVGVSFLVGFPVFCLFCPIGLFFGFLYALAKAFTVYTPSWDLVVFPLVLFLEFGLFRRWCSAICPLGALMSLIGRARPRPPRFRRRRAVVQDGPKRGSAGHAFADDLGAGHRSSACRSCGKCCVSAGAGNVFGAHDSVRYSKKGEVR